MSNNAKKKILIVEDEDALIMGLVSACTSSGFETLTAKNGEDGLRIALAERPDAIVLDLLMPRMNGLAMLEKLRTDEWGKGVPVIVWTNSQNAELEKRVKELGVGEYFIKSEVKFKGVVAEAKQLLEKKVVILLVDDEPVMRRLFGGRLQSIGYEVIYANDGNEGRETARRLQPDLILLDMNMPVMNGIEAADRMKEENETKHIPIIMFTNEDFSIEGEKALKELGVDGYVHKSADFKKLAERIKEVLKLPPEH